MVMQFTVFFFHKKFGQSKFNGKKKQHFYSLINVFPLVLLPHWQRMEAALSQTIQRLRRKESKAPAGVLSKRRVKRRVSLGRNRSLGTWPWYPGNLRLFYMEISWFFNGYINGYINMLSIYNYIHLFSWDLAIEHGHG
jgi:hypothetical protein